LLAVGGAALILVGFALLGLTEAPRHARYRLALARTAWRDERRERAPVDSARRSYRDRLGELPAGVQSGGRILSKEVADVARWLLGR
jgi:hypothetical protein